jgi:purine-binding chemotaxis protein CheW
MDLLVFEVEGIHYALPARQVREIQRAVTIVPLPQAPAIIEGIINVRGDLVPVLDVRSRFGRASRPVAPSDHLILAWAGPRLVAIRADRAGSLVTIEAANLEVPFRAAPGTRLIAGVAKLANGVVLIHDLLAFLDEAEATALDDALLTAARAGRSA